MSEENVEIVRRFYPDDSVDVTKMLTDEGAFRHFEAPLIPFIHPDFETVPDPSFAGMGGAGSRSTVGVDGFREVWRDWLSGWESWRIEVEQLVPLPGSRVLALIENHGRPKGSDAEMSLKGGAIWTLTAGQVTRLDLFLTRASALEAAGLEE
jgi:hypothetical protein